MGQRNSIESASKVPTAGATGGKTGKLTSAITAKLAVAAAALLIGVGLIVWQMGFWGGSAGTVIGGVEEPAPSSQPASGKKLLQQAGGSAQSGTANTLPDMSPEVTGRAGGGKAMVKPGP